MASTFSFDIVSEVDLQETDNAINQAQKEVAQRYDFKGANATVELDRKEKTIQMEAAAEFGLPEAQAIERRLKGIPIKRPQTHDLLANVIRELGGKLESITINDLSEHTFFATLQVRRDTGEVVNIDSRPSDAIALGVAENVPIYVAEHVLDSAQAGSGPESEP